MEMAYIFLNSDIGFERDVLKYLKDIPEVREAFKIYGVYDIIIKLEADTVCELKELTKEIRKMEKVRATLSMIVSD